MSSKDEFERCLAWRNIMVDEECPRCGGSGVRAYSSTAGRFGGIGGQAITSGVCDVCWGSGDRFKPWRIEKPDQTP